eukprot:TRINITY_DN65956_c0_g1_i1.p2 TRINITY_DN65956_c0_g1~~TRINITY_DN65956_c0_g1_i1.p2  ORF type:complete len:102 (+),score=3.18 TRINITY_DN65956_c0_g1_i1:153-458(+)
MYLKNTFIKNTPQIEFFLCIFSIYICENMNLRLNFIVGKVIRDYFSHYKKRGGKNSSKIFFLTKKKSITKELLLLTLGQNSSKFYSLSLLNFYKCKREGEA